MKRAIYEGEILEIGSGVADLKAMDVKGNRSVERDYIKIGKDRIRSVLLTSYMDSFLRLREKVTISGVQHKHNFVIAALKLDDGEVIVNDTSSAAFLVHAFKLIVVSFVISFMLGTFLGGVILTNLLTIRSIDDQFFVSAVLAIIIWVFISYRIAIRPLLLLRQARAAFNT